MSMWSALHRYLEATRPNCSRVRSLRGRTDMGNPPTSIFQRVVDVYNGAPMNSPRPPLSRLFAGPFPALERALLSRLSEPSWGGPGWEQVLLVPSNDLREHLMKRLASVREGAAVGASAMTLYDFALKLLLQHRGISPGELSPVRMAAAVFGGDEGRIRAGGRGFRADRGDAGFLRRAGGHAGGPRGGVDRRTRSSPWRRGRPRRGETRGAPPGGRSGAGCAAAVRAEGPRDGGGNAPEDLPGRREGVRAARLPVPGEHVRLLRFHPAPVDPGGPDPVERACSTRSTSRGSSIPTGRSPLPSSTPRVPGTGCSAAFEGNVEFLEDDPVPAGRRDQGKDLFLPPPASPEPVPFPVLSAPHEEGEMRLAARRVRQVARRGAGGFGVPRRPEGDPGSDGGLGADRGGVRDPHGGADRRPPRLRPAGAPAAAHDGGGAGRLPAARGDRHPLVPVPAAGRGGRAAVPPRPDLWDILSRERMIVSGSDWETRLPRPRRRRGEDEEEAGGRAAPVELLAAEVRAFRELARPADGGRGVRRLRAGGAGCSRGSST